MEGVEGGGGMAATTACAEATGVCGGCVKDLGLPFTLLNGFFPPFGHTSQKRVNCQPMSMQEEKSGEYTAYNEV